MMATRRTGHTWGTGHRTKMWELEWDPTCRLEASPAEPGTDQVIPTPLPSYLQTWKPGDASNSISTTKTMSRSLCLLSTSTGLIPKGKTFQKALLNILLFISAVGENRQRWEIRAQRALSGTAPGFRAWVLMGGQPRREFQPLLEGLEPQFHHPQSGANDSGDLPVLLEGADELT